jgi:hypothetical protein
MRAAASVGSEGIFRVDQSGSKLWEDMLEEFRALGGTAENVCLKNGRFGRGLFPVDPAKPISVRIPDSMLVEPKHVSVENGAFRLDAQAPVGAREKSFLENYQRDFSWGVAHHETEGLLQMFHAAPGELRELLRSPFNLDCWLEGATPQGVLDRFLASRIVQYKNKTVIMPIVELANHGLQQAQYKTDDGVGLSGHFDDEVLVSYNDGDPFLIFRSWGFVSRVQNLALSLSFGLKQEKLRINRKEPQAGEERSPLYPDVQKDGEKTILSHMLLGHKRNPGMPRGIFYRVCREAGLADAAGLFDRIQHINRMQFLRLAELSETAAPRLGRLLRNLAYAQLEVMSNNIGVREP